MIYVFLGKDFNIVKKQMDELIKSLNIDNIIKYDFTESNIREILDEVNYVDLFNEKKLIIVSNFSLKKLKDKDEELLNNYILNMNDNIIIFRLIDEELDNRKSITKTFKNKCKVIECKHLDYKNLYDYVATMFKENKLDITYYQVKKILDLCEYNVDYTINEVEKLIIYKIGDKKVTDKDIDEVISKNREKEMFTLTENVMDKNIAGSIESFKVLVSGKTESVVILDNLAKQFRLLYQTKILSKTMNETEISKNLSVNPFVIKKLYPYLNKYKEEEIINILYKLSDMDFDIKVSGYDKNKVLESFFLTL